MVTAIELRTYVMRGDDERALDRESRVRERAAYSARQSAVAKTVTGTRDRDVSDSSPA